MSIGTAILTILLDIEMKLNQISEKFSGIVYHGTNQPIENFEIPSYGVFFTPHIEWAKNYGSTIIAVQIEIERLYKVDYNDQFDYSIFDILMDRDYKALPLYIEKLKAKGYQALQTISDSEMIVIFPNCGVEIEIIDAGDVR